MQAPIIESSPTSSPHLDMPAAETADAAWKPLYRVGSVAALIGVVVIPIAIIVFVAWPPPSFQPTPSAVINWFRLLRDNTFLGLLSFDLLLMTGQITSALVLLALFIALRRISQSLTTIALAAGFVGVTVYLTANPVFSLLSLSNQYPAATTTERSQLVAAGQALLATYQGTPFDVAYVLAGVATLIIAVVMLRSTLFSKGIAYVGIVMGLLMLVPATAGTIGVVLSLVSLVPTMIWDILIARRLFQLGQGGSKPAAKQPAASTSHSV